MSKVDSGPVPANCLYNCWICALSLRCMVYQLDRERGEAMSLSPLYHALATIERFHERNGTRPEEIHMTYDEWAAIAHDIEVKKHLTVNDPRTAPGIRLNGVAVVRHGLWERQCWL